MSDINEMISGIKTDILALAQTQCSGFVAEAKADGVAFVEESKSDLAEWASLVAAGKMNTKELESLVRGKKILRKWRP